MKEPAYLSEAAVLIVIFADEGEEKVLLTKRSRHLREHAGEVAFPGGKRDHEDASLYQTALRECQEEVGLTGDRLRWQAELPAHYTRMGSSVTPFVAKLDSYSELRLNIAEIESAFWAPLSIFTNDQREKTHIFHAQRGVYWAPVYHYQGYEIWGLTARVLVSLVNRCYGKSLSRSHRSAPEHIYS